MSVGDIVLVPFPFSDLSAVKTRPALVLAKAGGKDFIVVAITSRFSRRAVKINNAVLDFGQLPVDSFVRYEKIVTLEKSLIRKSVARVNKKILDEVVLKVRALFD